MGIGNAIKKQISTPTPSQGVTYRSEPSGIPCRHFYSHALARRDNARQAARKLMRLSTPTPSQGVT